jgi:hypothetical protein
LHPPASAGQALSWEERGKLICGIAAKSAELVLSHPSPGRRGCCKLGVAGFFIFLQIQCDMLLNLNRLTYGLYIL